MVYIHVSIKIKIVSIPSCSNYRNDSPGQAEKEKGKEI